VAVQIGRVRSCGASPVAAKPSGQTVTARIDALLAPPTFAASQRDPSDEVHAAAVDVIAASRCAPTATATSWVATTSYNAAPAIVFALVQVRPSCDVQMKPFRVSGSSLPTAMNRPPRRVTPINWPPALGTSATDQAPAS
jgi:hypothetical protein